MGLLDFWRHTESKLAALRHQVAGLVGKEASMLEVAIAAQVKKELPILTNALYSQLKSAFAEAAAEVEREATAAASGDEKWSAAMSKAIAKVGQIGLNAAALSPTTRDTLLQAGVAVVKAGLVAIVSPTSDPSLQSPSPSGQK